MNDKATTLANLGFLATSAEGLDLNDEEDRSIFRTRVFARLQHVRVDAIREWVDTTSIDRYNVMRAAADALLDVMRNPETPKGQ